MGVVSGLRWHAQVRTTNGAITTYVRVREATAAGAAIRAQEVAYRKHKGDQEYGYKFRRSDWFVIYIGLHVADQNLIG